MSQFRLVYGSSRNQQSSIKSSKENTVGRTIGILGHTSSSGVGLPSSLERGPISESRGLVTDRVKLCRNVKSPSRNKNNSNNKSTNRLAEKNEKNRQARHQVEKEPEDKEKLVSPKSISELAAAQKYAAQKASVIAAMTAAELKEQQKIKLKDVIGP